MNAQTDLLNEADRTLHSLAQLLALTGTNCLPTQPDDSQANLTFNADTQRLEGRWFEINGQLRQLVIDLPDFSLYVVDGAGVPVASFTTEGQTPMQAMDGWQAMMRGWQINATKPLSYELPIPSETPYTRPAGLPDWADWRTKANHALVALNTKSGQTSDVRIWPHHFDTGVYYSFPDEAGAERAAIWAGLAIADTVCPEPYFYLSGYDTKNAIDFNAAPSLTTGQFLALPDWKGACLPVSAVQDSGQIAVFLANSYAWVAQQVGV